MGDSDLGSSGPTRPREDPREGVSASNAPPAGPSFPPPPGAGQSPGTPPPPSEPRPTYQGFTFTEGPPPQEPKPPRTKQWIMIGTIVAVALAGLVVIVLLRNRGPDLSIPESLNGEPQIHGPSVEVLITGVKAQIEKQGVGAVVGIFGTTAQPRFMVVGLDEPPPPGTHPLRAASAGFEGAMLGAAGNVDTASITQRSVGSTFYECAPYSITGTASPSSLSASICAWDDGETTGLIMTFDPGIDAMDLSITAHDAVVG